MSNYISTTERATWWVACGVYLLLAALIGVTIFTKNTKPLDAVAVADDWSWLSQDAALILETPDLNGLEAAE